MAIGVDLAIIWEDIFLKTSPSVMITAFVILTLVGVTAGLWPALKASRLEPVEALRYE